ncbi:hypothetical protein V502_04004 [Pseudogymnoascus sp. VKM F-4520 (FW-2644)]|nr:hypothetical protein V502_04004 [Pseudogymnoascus sp. VKM F-4520 (FW-2644)]
MASQSTSFDLPGFSLPLNYTPNDRTSHYLFPNALDYSDVEGGYMSRLNTHRDLLMMQVINSITEKPEWDRKVFDDKITSKWRKEIADSGKDITPKMIDWIIKELQWKADIFCKTGKTVAFDAGVVKSDTLIPVELQQALKDAVHPLEDIPEEQKDYHPGSDNKVVNLVHPSLFPIIYGRTRILPDQLIGLDDCPNSAGQGQLLSVPPEEQAVIPNYGWGYRRGMMDERRNDMSLKAYSRKFQWMPCDIEFTKDDGCCIVSYINNLHPQENRTLYEVIEKFLAQIIPLWDTTLTNVQVDYNRIEYTEVHFDHSEPDFEIGDDMIEYLEREEQWRNSVIRPEPGEFQPPKVRSHLKIDLRQKFAEKGLQVIVKLANIELTPEKPQYEGGSWHVEGQLNEHICATALYYYDSKNITENTLSFRQRATTRPYIVSHPQCEHEFLYEVFGFGRDILSQGETKVTQDLGSVPTHEGRLLTFPNILQHRVSPFSLADRSKPGHRKIIAFFLVDPNLRVISSANVPPQREDWSKERKQVVDELLGERLPVELQDMVTKNMDATTITMDEAKQYRLELMEERKAGTVEQNEKFESGDFSLLNNEKNTRKSIKATAVGTARVMSYKDIVKAQKQRDIKEAAAEAARGRRGPKRNPPAQILGKRSRSQELEEAQLEINAAGMEKYCSVLKFN